MYTCIQGLDKVLGVSIITDSGINLDHTFIISKLDLRLENFQVRKEREEYIDFQGIINIPVQNNLVTMTHLLMRMCIKEQISHYMHNSMISCNKFLKI